MTFATVFVTTRFCSTFIFQAEDGIRAELYGLLLVELVGGPDQAEVALVDQVRERYSLVLVFLVHGDDEPEVGAHQLVQRLRIPLLSPLGLRPLLLACDQRLLADLLQAP